MRVPLLIALVVVLVVGRQRVMNGVGTTVPGDLLAADVDRDRSVDGGVRGQERQRDAVTEHR